MTKETNLQIVLQDTLALLDTKEEKIRNLTKKVADLTERAEFWEHLADKRLQKTIELKEKIKELEYQKRRIQCVLHDCFMTLLENKIIKPDMKFYKDIVNAKEL